VIVIDRYHELVQIAIHTLAEIGFRCTTLREIEEIIASPSTTTIQKSAWCTTTQKSAFGVLPFEKLKKLLQVQAHYHSEIGLVHYHSEIGFWCTTTQKSGFGVLPFEKLEKLLQVQLLSSKY
jgi:hypothetical protein